MRRPRLMCCLCSAVFAAGGVINAIHLMAADPQSDESLDDIESAETTRLIVAELPQWKLWTGPERAKALKLEPKSVLRWTNPGSGRVYGDVYLWTADGRPEVVMSLFKAWDPANGFHVELQSLSLGEIEGERDGRMMWQPLKSGVELNEVQAAAPPAETAALRLAQMRSMAREFTAVLTDRRVSETGELQSLRLLPHPMYRYESQDPALIDGALFAFTMGTDPEVFLMLEARRSAGRSRWDYGLARMNNDSIAVVHKDLEVWHTEPAENRDPLHDAYVLTRVPEAP